MASVRGRVLATAWCAGAWCGKGSGQGTDVAVSDVKRSHPYRVGGAVDHHVADTGCRISDEVAFGAGIAGALAQYHRGLGGFGHAQSDPHGEQLPHRQGVFGGVLDRGHHR